MQSGPKRNLDYDLLDYEENDDDTMKRQRGEGGGRRRRGRGSRESAAKCTPWWGLVCDSDD